VAGARQTRSLSTFAFYRRGWGVASDLVQGAAAARVPWQAPAAPAQGHSRVPNVHLQAGLLPNQVAHYPMGQAIDQTV
jgi:hypothetical protein